MHTPQSKQSNCDLSQLTNDLHKALIPRLNYLLTGFPDSVEDLIRLIPNLKEKNYDENGKLNTIRYPSVSQIFPLEQKGLPSSVEISIKSTIDLQQNLSVLYNSDLSAKIEIVVPYAANDLQCEFPSDKELSTSVYNFTQSLAQAANLTNVENPIDENHYHSCITTWYHNGVSNGIVINLLALPKLKATLETLLMQKQN
jgi:hypothetical protein